MKTKLIILTAIIFTSIASGQVTRNIDEENVPVIRSIDITEKTVTDDEDVSVPCHYGSHQQRYFQGRALPNKCAQYRVRRL